MWKLISNLILRNRITIICVLVVITIFLGYNATKVQLQYYNGEIGYDEDYVKEHLENNNIKLI